MRRFILIAIAIVCMASQGHAGEYAVDSKSIQNLKALLRTQINKNKLSSKVDTKSLKNLSQRQGGVSDGGGNAVGAVFFDFYENEGSFLVNPKSIVWWNPLVESKLKELNRKIPHLRYADGEALGDALEKLILSKKWYLETKDLDSGGCRNDSMVQTRDQTVAGCQNDYEVRLSAQWLLNVADSHNQAALIVHEAFLAWARENDKSPKDVLEFKVREMNRAFFDSESPAVIKAQLEKFYPGHSFYSSDDDQSLNSIAGIQRQTEQDFCAGRPLSLKDKITAIKKNDLLYKVISAAIDPIFDLDQAWKVITTKKQIGLKTADDEERWFKRRQEFCQALNKKTVSVRFRPEMLDSDCKASIEEALGSYIRVRNNFAEGLLTKHELENIVFSQEANVHFRAERCSKKEVIQEQAVRYYEILKQKVDTQVNFPGLIPKD